MKIIKKILALIIFTIFIQSSCDDPIGVDRVWRFWVENNSDLDIRFSVSRIYPDTSLPLSKPITAPVDKNGGKTPYDSKTSWEDVFYELPADTLSVFIFSKDTLIQNEWEYIQTNYIILKRYDLSYQDLENMEWVLKYQ